jgi:uncharacterized iron-regulated membrane protein
LFQVHLWTGIAFGLYILMISLTGSALVFRDEMYGYFGAKAVIVSSTGDRMTKEQLKQVAERDYSGYDVVRYWENPGHPNQAVEIVIARGDREKQRLLNPYTGEDIGAAVPLPIRVLSWLRNLHINLLYGDTGRAVNAGGALLLVVLTMTGAVVWWPGVGNWRRSITINWNTGWKRINWDMHSAVGFWMFALLFMWGITGIHVSLPSTFWSIVDHFEPPDDRNPELQHRVGDAVLRWSAQLHFGNFSGWKVKALWVVLGLAPAMLFATGALVWWNRVLSPRIRRRG